MDHANAAVAPSIVMSELRTRDAESRPASAHDTGGALGSSAARRSRNTRGPIRAPGAASPSTSIWTPAPHRVDGALVGVVVTVAGAGASCGGPPMSAGGVVSSVCGAVLGGVSGASVVASSTTMRPDARSAVRSSEMRSRRAASPGAARRTREVRARIAEKKSSAVGHPAGASYRSTIGSGAGCDESSARAGAPHTSAAAAIEATRTRAAMGGRRRTSIMRLARAYLLIIFAHGSSSDARGVYQT